MTIHINIFSSIGVGATNCCFVVALRKAAFCCIKNPFPLSQLSRQVFYLKNMNMNQYHLSGGRDVWNSGTSSLSSLDECAYFASSSVLSLLLSGQPAPERRKWDPDWLCHRVWYGVSPEWQGWWRFILACPSIGCCSMEVHGWCFSRNVPLPSQSMRKSWVSTWSWNLHWDSE